MAERKPHSAEVLLGVDLGAAEVKVAYCPPEGAPAAKIRLACRASPLDSLLQALEKLPDTCVRVGITGIGQALLEGWAESLFVNEVVAAATAVRRAFPEARTVIELGAQHSKFIMLGRPGEPDTIVDFASNGMCAAGAGAFLEQQASRLGLTLDELARMAVLAGHGATIAGRCSVFAKSDMIHLQQKGTPLDEIALGLCQTLARTFSATIIQSRKVEPPVLLLGGCATNAGIVRAFREQLSLGEDQLTVPEAPQFYGATGAAWMAAEAPVTKPARLLAALVDRMRHDERSNGKRSLPPLRSTAVPAAPPAESLSPPRGALDVYQWVARSGPVLSLRP